MNFKVYHVTLIFTLFSLIFFFDRIGNYFTKAPLYIISLLVLFPYLSYFLLTHKSKFFGLTWFVVIVIFLLSSITYGMHIKDISDILQIFSLIFSIVYYDKHLKTNTLKPIYIFFFLCTFLLSFSLVGIDNGMGSTMGSDSKNVEYLREYNQGLFRLAHVASYFFSFLSLFYLNLYSYTKNYKNIIVGMASFILVLYIGSRTTLATFAVLYFFYYFKLKYLKIIIPIIASYVLIFLNIKPILSLLSGTVLFQYFSILKTISEDTSKLSRIIIWSSWYEEITKFDFVDLLIGKSFFSSFIANQKNGIGPIWFHNDFLSVIYTYGIIFFALYTFCFYYFYKKYKTAIRSNPINFILFFSMPLSGFFNGFYNYFPILLIYISIFSFKLYNERILEKRK